MLLNLLSVTFNVNQFANLDLWLSPYPAKNRQQIYMLFTTIVRYHCYTLANVAVKERITEEAVFGVVERRVNSKIDWKNIKSLGVIGMDDISLKKGYKDFVTVVTSRVDRKMILLAILKCCENDTTIVGFLKNITNHFHQN